MNICKIVGDSKYPSGKFRKVLWETGENLCDTCPYPDCIADQRQCVSLWHEQEKYRKTHRPPCDIKILEEQARLRNLEIKENKREYGRKRGRPKKEKI